MIDLKTGSRNVMWLPVICPDISNSAFPGISSTKTYYRISVLVWHLFTQKIVPL